MLFATLIGFGSCAAIGFYAMHKVKQAGFDSDIYAVDTHDDVRSEALDPKAFRSRARRSDDAWILYHFSIGSPLFDFVRELDVPLALDYHNVTEAKYFWRWEPVPSARPRRITREVLAGMPVSTESTALSKDLKRRGFRFVGPTTVYAFMQSAGLVDDHLEGCFVAGTTSR